MNKSRAKTLAEGAREIERLIRDEVRSKRETLDDALRGVSEAETTMQTIRDGAEEIAEAMRRVARELREPHDAVEATTKTLERIAATGETLRAATKIIKLANKLDECYIRPLVFLGDGAMGLGTRSNSTRVAIITWRWGAYLGEEGLNRLGNVIVPNECYGEILEKVVLPWLDEIEEERSALNPDNPWLGFGLSLIHI